MYEPMHVLIEEHDAAKRRMVLGIVFTAIAFLLSVVAFAIYYVAIFDSIMYDYGYGYGGYPDFESAAVPLWLSLPCWGVGLPFLITGIIRTAKANRRITHAQEAADAQRKAAQQPAQRPVYQQPAYQQPVYQQPNYQQPVYQQPNYQQSAYQQPVQQPVYQQPAHQQPVQQPVYQQSAYQQPVQPVPLPVQEPVQESVQDPSV